MKIPSDVPESEIEMPPRKVRYDKCDPLMLLLPRINYRGKLAWRLVHAWMLNEHKFLFGVVL